MTVLESTSPVPSAPAKPSLFAPLATLNFRLLWAGQGISLLGDQFYLVALPWLTFRLSGSGTALGMTLMLAGLPRALLTVFGGVWSDRISPRWIMLASNLLRFALTAALTALLLANQAQLWMLYLISFLFGIVDAFFLPAQMSLIPSLLKPDQLQSGNALFQVTTQLSQFVGPALAGLAIAAFGQSGIGSAIGFDALTFLVAAGALRWMRSAPNLARPTPAAPRTSALASLKEGFQTVSREPVLIGIILITCLVNLLFIGPLAVGIPAMAALRFTQGAAALGALISAIGAGSLVGAALAGSLRPRRLGLTSYLTIVVIGLGWASLGIISSLPLAALACFVSGVGTGYTNVLLISALQKRIAPELRGRVMSILIMGSMGASPLSNALSGVVVDLSLPGLFLGAGALLVGLGLFCLASRRTRKIADELE